MKFRQVYRGIEFVRVKDLPEDLKKDITNWLNDDILIKIRTDQGLFNDCIQIKDFEYWYNNIYTPMEDISESGNRIPVKGHSIKLAFDR